jgi:hypothetical protein
MANCARGFVWATLDHKRKEARPSPSGSCPLNQLENKKNAILIKISKLTITE